MIWERSGTGFLAFDAAAPAHVQALSAAKAQAQPGVGRMAAASAAAVAFKVATAVAQQLQPPRPVGPVGGGVVVVGAPGQHIVCARLAARLLHTAASTPGDGIGAAVDTVRTLIYGA